MELEELRRWPHRRNVIADRSCLTLLARSSLDSFLCLFSYPTPILRPLWPFMAAGGIVFYAVNRMQEAGVSTPEARKDPKNPYGESALLQTSVTQRRTDTLVVCFTSSQAGVSLSGLG